MTIPSSRSLILWISDLSITSPSADCGHFRKSSDVFGRLRTSSEEFGLLRESSEMIIRLQKSQHSQDKNLTLISQKKLAGILSDPDRLCCSPFWKSITASHILAGTRHVARRVTEGRRPKGDRGTNCRVKKWTREETCTRGLRSLWTASLGDGSEWDRKRKGNRPLLFENQNISCGGSFKDLRDLCEGNRVLIEVKIFQDWTFVVHVDSLQYLKQVSLVQRLPSSRKTHSQRRKR